MPHAPQLTRCKPSLTACTTPLTCPPELAQHPVPTLILQPLVENAIKHGLEPKVEGGPISVQARCEAGRITLEVQDTGVGLPTDYDPMDGFGLAQVRERLVTTYGPHVTIEIIAAHACGTMARVTFPINFNIP